MAISVTRAKILREIVDKPMTISELSKLMGKGYSRTTIYHNIEELKERGLIIEQPATQRRGKRVPKLLIATDKAKPLIRKFFDMYESYQNLLKE